MNATNRLTTTQPVLQGGNAGERPLSFGHSPCYGIPRWYVIEAEYHASKTARDSITGAGLETYLPTRVIMQRKRRHGVQCPPEPVFVPIFYQFLFARFDAANDRWPSRHLEGVKRVLLGQNQRPYPVPDARIDEIRAYEASVSKLPEKRMPKCKVGDLVLINAGIESGKVGTVLKCNGYHTDVAVKWDNGITACVTLSRADVSDE